MPAAIATPICPSSSRAEDSNMVNTLASTKRIITRYPIYLSPCSSAWESRPTNSRPRRAPCADWNGGDALNEFSTVSVSRWLSDGTDQAADCHWMGGKIIEQRADKIRSELARGG